ncbi:hypothetical protein HZB88_02355 [archaeon]|nr:hypothetical protein [archaeon]
MAFIIDIVPKGRDTKTEIYLRENCKSSSLVMDIPHIIPTWALGWDIAEQIYNACLSNQELQELGVRFKIVPVGRRRTNLDKYTREEFEKLKRVGKFSVWAYGPRKMKDFLPHAFIRGSRVDQRNNVARMLRIRYNMPFSVYGSKEEIPINSLLQEQIFAFDLEFRNRPVYNDLFLAAIITNNRNYILAKEDIGISTLPVSTDFGQHELHVVHTDSISRTLEELIYDICPLFVTGHNIGGYDIRRLRDEFNFHGSVEVQKGNKLAKTKARKTNAGFFSKWTIPGRYVVDAAPFSLHYLPTINNKLPTVASFLFRLPIEKELSYEELERYAYSNQRICAEYVAKDALLSFQICKNILKPALLLSYALRQEPSAICCTSKDNLGIDVHEQLQFERLHTYGYRTLESAKRLEEFDMYKKQLRLLKMPKPRKGWFKARICFPIPFLKGFYPVLAADKHALNAYEEIFNAQDWIDKVILAQGLNAYLKKALFDLCLLSEDKRIKQLGLFQYEQDFITGLSKFMDIKNKKIEPRADWFYGKIFGKEFGKWPETRNVSTLSSMLMDSFDRLSRFIAHNSLINYSGKYLVFSQTADFKEISDIVIDCGYADVFSLAGRSFIAYNEGRLFVQSKDLTGKKGDKCKLEQEYIPLIADAVFRNDKERAVQYIESCLKELKEEDKERLVFRNIMRRHFYDFRHGSLSRKRVQAAIIAGKMKGEENKFGFTKEEGITSSFLEEGTVDIDAYRAKFFGPLINSKRNGGSLGCFLYPILGNLSDYVDRVQLRLF